jgi:hypothetical protein
LARKKRSSAEGRRVAKSPPNQAILRGLLCAAAVVVLGVLALYLAAGKRHDPVAAPHFAGSAT